MLRTIHQSKEVNRIIRNTHAAEVFRSAYLESSRSPIRISTSDLDDVVMAQRTRPSALLGLFTVAGGVLGTASRVLPGSCKQVVHTMVNDVTMQQMNDNVRELQTMHVSNDDLKETIKYHRDMDMSSHTADSSTHPHTTAQGTQQINYLQTVVSTTLAKILKVTRDI